MFYFLGISFGFGCRKRIIRIAITIDSDAVTNTFISHVDKLEHTTDPTMLPILALTDQNARRSPLFPLPNQFPIVAIIPGHPVL